MSNNRVLKPCPFCGGEAEIFEYDGNFGVCCENAACIGNDLEARYSSEYYAIKGWNRRATDVQQN